MNTNKKLNHNKLKELRLKHKNTQKDLAKYLNVSEQAIAYYEQGKREPKLETWQKLADFFGVSVPYLQGIEKENTYTYKDLSQLLYEAYKEDFSFNPYPSDLIKRLPKLKNKNHLINSRAEIKKLYKNEFLNNLSGIIYIDDEETFNDDINNLTLGDIDNLLSEISDMPTIKGLIDVKKDSYNKDAIKKILVSVIREINIALNY